MKPAETVPELLIETARLHGDKMALRQPFGGQVQTWTWTEYLQAAEEIAAGLKALGIGRGDHVAICSETRAEFYLVDQGILMNGSVAAALYPSYPPEELKKTIRNSDAKVLFVEDPKMFRKLPDASVQHIILMTGEAEGAISLAELRRHGRHRGEVAGEDLAILYLTSGATGEPKMVMVTHASLVSNVRMAPAVLPLSPEDITIAFLPSAHIAQRLVVELLPMFTGTPVSFCEGLMKLQGEIRSVRPTFFLAPPRVWERVYTSIRTEIMKRPALLRKIFFGALGMGIAAGRYKRRGEPIPARLRIPLDVAHKLFFSKIRDRFGGRLRVAASGAAPLGAELAEFYEAIGMPLVEGFGLTEGGVAMLNPIDAPRPGSVGKLLPGIQIRFDEEGELLIKSPSLCSGYYKDPEASAAVLEGGWLHTGDIAEQDADGYVYITGRKKELIVSSNGKKVFPARVERMFQSEAIINQVFLAGDKLPHLVALFTLSNPIAEGVAGAKAEGVPLHESKAVVREVQAAVNRVNKQLAPFEQVKRFKLIGREFSIEHGEVTATLKVRRKQVMENFKAEIDSLYQLSASGRGGE